MHNRAKLSAAAEDVTSLSHDDLGAAFAKLQQSLRSYLRRRVSDATLADDLLQEVFVKALTSKRAGRRIDNLTGWLFAAARTTLVDYYRANGTPTQDLDESMPNQEDAEDLRLHSEVASCLNTFLAQLPSIYRDTLVATELDSETQHSIAEKQAVSVSAIKSRAARGRAMLKQKLLECCYVEMVSGVVYDYHRNSPSGCDGKCA